MLGMDDWSQQNQSHQSPLLPSHLAHERDLFQAGEYLARYSGGDANNANFSFSSEGVSGARHSSPAYHVPSSQGSPATIGTPPTERTADMNQQYDAMDVTDKNVYVGHQARGNRQPQQRQRMQVQSRKETSPTEEALQVEASSSGQGGQSGTPESSKPQDSRYVNTMVALEKAGLLEITLKTADLIKKNESLQREIDVLEDIVKAAYALYSN